MVYNVWTDHTIIYIYNDICPKYDSDDNHDENGWISHVLM